jgi:hypothetical protein
MASRKARAAKPKSERVGISATPATPPATVMVVGSPAAGVAGLFVTPDDSLVPLPSPSKLNVPWFEMLVPGAVPALMVAVMVMVTEPADGMAPFQVTVLVPTVATAVPEVALALTRVRLAGRTSVNSSPGLSPWLPPLLVRTTV